VNTKQLTAILRSESGHNTIFEVDFAGKKEPAIVKDWQVDPVSGKLLHVDLLRVAMDVRMKVKVPVHTFGEPSGVKVQGGVYEVVTREVEVECLPADIPTEFRMDVSGLMLNQSLRANELPIDKTKLKLLTDGNSVLAHVVALRVEEEKPVEAAAVVAEVPAEPEVIKKGKKAPSPPKNRRRRSNSVWTASRDTPCGSLSALAILARNISGRRITWVFWRWTK
jgi:large subunit ribosomal protein L25